ncbi:MAG: hypothetical protein J5819_03715 [Eubacterium sp.]|nr:hypothetical protein [Eubacterium sp.]
MEIRHPLTEFTAYIILLLFISFSLSPYSLGVILLGLILMKPRTIPVVLIVVTLTTVINPLVNHKGETYLFYLNDNIVTLESVIYGVVLGMQVSSLILAFKLMSDNMTSDKIISVTSYLAPPLALVLSMAIRSLGRYTRKTGEVYRLQKSFAPGGNFFYRIIVLINTFSIMIGWILENSIETADSMVVRGYGSHRRTTYHNIRISIRDFLEILVIIGVFILFLLTRADTVIIPFIYIGFDAVNLVATIVFVIYLIIYNKMQIDYK